MSIFLTKEEVAELTGRKTKAKQIEQLRSMGLVFWVNAHGVPVVPRSVIEGRKEQPKVERAQWVPPGMRQSFKEVK